jgi:uracil-DNA glycosylase family 4
MRCALCPNVNCQIPPHGPKQREGLLFVFEAPGKQEDTNARRHPPGIPLIGKTGQEVDEHYLPLAGLRRSDVTCHNAISCLPDSVGGKLDPTRDKDTELLESCASQNLYPLIGQMQPKLIIPCGNFSCRAIFGPGFDLELRHGIPTESPYGPAFPMYHPALGLHEPKKMLHVRTDWDRLRKYLRGRLVVPVDAYAGQEDYQEVTDADEIAEISDDALACDTESDRNSQAYCLTYSQQPGSGRLIRAANIDLIDSFKRRVRDHRGPVLFHNWLYDWTVVEQMGILFQHRAIVDTMAEVYRLGNLPQGLKALAFRELGMTMQDFDDVVTPHSTRKVLEYYEQASWEDWPKLEPQMVLDEAGQWKLYKPQSMKTKFKRFFTDYRKSPETKDVFGSWENWESQHATIEAVLGPWPGKDIRHAPFEDVLFYACRDSDALGRLWPILKKMRTLTRRYSQESWRERAA